MGRLYAVGAVRLFGGSSTRSRLAASGKHTAADVEIFDGPARAKVVVSAGRGVCGGDGGGGGMRRERGKVLKWIMASQIFVRVECFLVYAAGYFSSMLIFSSDRRSRVYFYSHLVPAKRGATIQSIRV